MTDAFKVVEHRRAWCTMGVDHEPHPFQELDKNGPKPVWDDLWCSGRQLYPGEVGQLVAVLYNDACWCQDPERLSHRMSAAIGHVLDKVREIVDRHREDDTWIDRWDTTQTREIVAIGPLLFDLEILQHGEEIEEVGDDDDDE